MEDGDEVVAGPEEEAVEEVNELELVAAAVEDVIYLDGSAVGGGRPADGKGKGVDEGGEA